MKIIVVANPSAVNNESKIINRLFDNGLDTFHLRKDLCTRDYCKQLILEIDEAYHDKIALHQHHDLAADFGINRLHYKEEFRKQLQMNNALPDRKNKVLSTSIHKLQDMSNLDGFDYTFFGPVFSSISKPGYSGVLNKDFKLPPPVNDTKIIAIGGINKENAPMLYSMGFDGLAVLGFIWNDPSKALYNFKSIYNRC